jgi:hypothetical protein
MFTEPTIDTSGPDPQTNYFLTELKYGADDEVPDLFTKSWIMYLGDYDPHSANPQVSWEDPNSLDFGISGIHLDNSVYTLQNNMFYGFRVNGFNSDTFLIEGPNPSIPVAVPEPASFVLAICALVGFSLVRGPRARLTTTQSDFV